MGKAREKYLNLIRLLLLLFFLASNAAAQTETVNVLHNFAGGTTDGRFPEAGLIRDAAGNLYGTTYFGGSSVCQYGCGTIFKLDTSNNFTVLHNFSVAEVLKRD